MPKKQRSGISAAFLSKLGSVEARKHKAPAHDTKRYADWEREKAWKRGVTTVDGADGVYTYDFDSDCSSSRAGQVERIAIKEGHGMVGHRVWDGASLMGKWLESSDLHWSTRSLVELGTGTGIVAMVLGRLDAVRPRRIVATDLGPVVRQAERHVEANGLGGVVKCVELEWGNSDHETVAMDAAGLRLPSDDKASAAAAAATDAAASSLLPATALAAAPAPASDAAAPEPSGIGIEVPLLLACDLAAPVACVEPLLDTIGRLLSHSSQGLPVGADVGSGAPASSEHGGLEGSSAPEDGAASGSGASGSGAAGVAESAVVGEAGPGTESSVTAAEGDEVEEMLGAGALSTEKGMPAFDHLPMVKPADLADDRDPSSKVLYLLQSREREFTPPLVAGLARRGCRIARIPQEMWHPGYRADRFVFLRVTGTGAGK